MVTRNAPGFKRAEPRRIYMKVKVVSQQSILQETVEAIYLYVNDRTVEDIRQDFLQTCNEPLDEEEQQHYAQLFQAIDDILRKSMAGLNRNNPRLQFFFQNFGKKDMEPNCLAWVMLGAFYGGKYFSFDESLQECRQEFLDFARDNFSHYKITGINAKGLLIFPMEEGETPMSLLDQVEGLDLPWSSKWNIYKCLNSYDTMLEELQELIRPVALRMQAAMDDHDALFQQVVRYWQGYFTGHNFHDYIEKALGLALSRLSEETKEAVIWLSWMGENDIDHYQGTNWEALNIGILARAERSKKTAGYIQEDVLNILKLLSDKSKFEIVQRLANHGSYGLELAGEMQLTCGTISKHLTTLFSYGLLRQQRVDSRVYYRTNEAAIRRFLGQLEKGLLGTEKSS